MKKVVLFTCTVLKVLVLVLLRSIRSCAADGAVVASAAAEAVTSMICENKITHERFCVLHYLVAAAE